MASWLQVLARRTGAAGAWTAWIPVANLFLMARIGGVSAGWAVTLLVPVLGLVAACVVWAGIARARGKPGWLGLLVVVPLVNLLVPPLLALGPASGRRCPACGVPAQPEDLFCGQCRHRLEAPAQAAPASPAPLPRPPARPSRGGGCLLLGCLGAGLAILLATGLGVWLVTRPLEYEAPLRNPPLLGSVQVPEGGQDLAALLPATPPPGFRLRSLRVFHSDDDAASRRALEGILTPGEQRGVDRVPVFLAGQALVAVFQDDQERSWPVVALRYPDPRAAWRAWEFFCLAGSSGVFTGLQDTYAMVRTAGGRPCLVFQKGPWIVLGVAAEGQDDRPVHDLLRTFQL